MSEDAQQPVSYAAAVAELEQLLGDLEDATVDVDLLVERMRRASVLVRFCRERIAGARLEVDQIVDDLHVAAGDMAPSDEPDEPPDGPAPEPPAA